MGEEPRYGLIYASSYILCQLKVNILKSYVSILECALATAKRHLLDNYYQKIFDKGFSVAVFVRREF